MKKLCVIFGGASTEHDISIITGMQLGKNLKSKDVQKIYLGLDNKMYLATKIEDLSAFEDFKNNQKINKNLIKNAQKTNNFQKNGAKNTNSKTNLAKIKNAPKLKEVIIYNNAVYSKSCFFKKLFDIECMINCCHGGVGEGGDLAGFFAVNNVRFTSAKSLPAHIAMDKSLAKELVKEIVPTIKGVKITKQNFEAADELVKDFGMDLIVKPNSLGSSIGVKACDKQNFTEQIEAIFMLNDDALVEERVVNLKEYNQACFMQNGKLVLSEIENPLTKHDILSFEDKYQTGSFNGKKCQDRIIPAKIPKKLEKQISNYTRAIYNKLGMNGVCRIDYIYDQAKNMLYFNEINTIPGSMAFYLYEGLGIDYISLVENLVENASLPTEYTNFETDILFNKNL